MARARGPRELTNDGAGRRFWVSGTATLGQRKVLGRKEVAPYTPDFRKAVDHYCIHAGGRAVIDGLEQNLQLPISAVLPSRATLNRVGNTCVCAGRRSAADFSNRREHCEA